MPAYEFVERHSIRIPTDVTRVELALRNADLSSSLIVRLLLALRGIPRTALRLSNLEQIGFQRLAHTPCQETVFGLIGRFWTLRGDIECVAPADFLAFNEPGFAKAAWNFSMRETTPGETMLETETRVHCTDAESRRRFARYWVVIRPFSGFIRRQALAAVRDAALSG